MPRLKATVGLLASAMLVGLAPAAIVSADDLIPSTVVLAPQSDVDDATVIVLTASVTEPADGYDADGATIAFTSTVGGGPSCDLVAVSTTGTDCTLGTLTAGSYTYEASYSGNTTVAPSTSPTISFEVTAAPPPPPTPSSVQLTSPDASVLAGADVVLTADVTADPGYDTGATITFASIAGGGPVPPGCVDKPVDTSGTTCDLGSGLAVGTYTYEATYSGNATTASSSDQFTFEVTAEPDTVLDASGVTRDYSTFYPVKDGYRDVLTLSGMRNEPITVTIRIYGPTGKKVLTRVLASASGAYAAHWSGRSSSGKVLASGKYKIVQTLKDLAGNSLVVTKYSTISHNKLVTRTTYVTKKGKSVSAFAGTVLVHRTIGYAKLVASSANPAAVGYHFSIPSATRYKSISFQIYAKGRSGGHNSILMQNFTWCAYSGNWDIGCFDRIKAFSSSSLKWHTTSGSPKNNRSGTHVRGSVYADRGTVYVYKVRVKVVYQVLR
jgi:hypothetical protein